MQVGMLSAASGVKIETIRYYEKVGLLPKPVRAGNGRRVYDQADAERLSFIRRARLLGFPMADIRAILALRAPKAGNATVRTIAERHLATVRARLADLRALEDMLILAIDDCQAGRGDVCPVVAAIAKA